jgi:AcrR family transcriptional regulator
VDGEEQTVFVNVNSLAKRLGISKGTIFEASKKHTLEKLVEDAINRKVEEISQEPPSIALPIKAPPLKLGSFMERVKGALADAWWQFTTGSWNLFRFRFLLA